MNSIRIGAYEVAPYHENPASFFITRIAQDGTREVVTDDIHDINEALAAARGWNARDVAEVVADHVGRALEHISRGERKAASSELTKARDLLAGVEATYA